MSTSARGIVLAATLGFASLAGTAHAEPNAQATASVPSVRSQIMASLKRDAQPFADARSSLRLKYDADGTTVHAELWSPSTSLDGSQSAELLSVMRLPLAAGDYRIDKINGAAVATPIRLKNGQNVRRKNVAVEGRRWLDEHGPDSDSKMWQVGLRR